MFFYLIFFFLLLPKTKIESKQFSKTLCTEQLSQVLPYSRRRSKCCFILLNTKSFNTPKNKKKTHEFVIPKAVPIDNEVRLRFAPSPTGSLHVGGCRTFLYNYILAKQLNGNLILRFDDTDNKRNSTGSKDEIIKDLKWLGLHWDEGPDKGGSNGPYNQSERMGIYEHFAHEMVNQGKAYFCFCSKEELLKKKEKATLLKKKYVYDRTCRYLSSLTIKENLENNRLYSIRFKSPDNRKIVLNDILKNTITSVVNEDFIILRSNKLSTYNFSTSVDDHLMKITYVIRGVEHVSNTFKQILILEALNTKIPFYAHIPVLTTPEKKKISKRKNEYTIKFLREDGFKPECVINYLATLGWGSVLKKEFYTLEELIQEFNITALNKSSTVFDMNKLKWMNKCYLTKQDEQIYITEAMQYLLKQKVLTENTQSKDFIELCIKVFKNEVHSYSELKENILKLLVYKDITEDKTYENDEVLRSVSRCLYEWSEKFNESPESLEVCLEQNYDVLIETIMKKLQLKKKEVLLKVRFLLTFQNKGIPFIFLIQIWKLAKKNNIPNYFSLKEKILHLKQVFHL